MIRGFIPHIMQKIIRQERHDWKVLTKHNIPSKTRSKHMLIATRGIKERELLSQARRQHWKGNTRGGSTCVGIGNNSWSQSIWMERVSL